MFDTVIRGGTVVDGTGAAPTTGDVAITGGRIVAVGAVDGAGRQEIDADGAIVTQPSTGYLATIVGGEVVRRDDADTGARPGRLVRSGRTLS